MLKESVSKGDMRFVQAGKSPDFYYRVSYQKRFLGIIGYVRYRPGTLRIGFWVLSPAFNFSYMEKCRAKKIRPHTGWDTRQEALNHLHEVYFEERK